MKLKLAKLDTSPELITDPYKFKSQYDDNSIVVYQAFKHEIADFAVANQKFGGSEFSFNRRIWIKPSFLWMMYRSGWGEKENQERILAIHLDRDFFDELVQLAVPTSFDGKKYLDINRWRNAYHHSDVVVQMDPDRNYLLHRSGRKAIQLGLRRQKLKEYALEELLLIEDITDFVKEQHANIKAKKYNIVELPEEKEYIKH
jgi:hypothetical protein